MAWGLRKISIIIMSIFLVVVCVHGKALAGELTLLEDHIYRLASFTDKERSDILNTMRRANPKLVITDLTRDADSVRIHFGTKGYLEILRSELYSLTSYIPHGIEREITRRSRGDLLVGRIRKTGGGIKIFMGEAG